MTEPFERKMDKLIEELEAKVGGKHSENAKSCQDTARLAKFYEGVTYKGAYITALLQKIDSYRREENG